MMAGFLVLFKTTIPLTFASIPFWGVLLVSLLVVLFFTFVILMIARPRINKPSPEKGGMVGLQGTIRDTLVPQPGKTTCAGMVLVKGELWKAEAAESIYVGENVVVTAVNGLTLTVKRTVNSEQ